MRIMGQALAALEAFIPLQYKRQNFGPKNNRHKVPWDVEIGN